MHSLTSLFSGLLVATTAVMASPTAKLAEQPVVTYVGLQNEFVSSGAWTNKGILFTCGTVPVLSDGSVVAGGVPAQTAQIIKNINDTLQAAGTSWDYVLKTNVYLTNMDDYTAMNEVYMAMLPHPKPGRTTVQVSRLPGNFSVEIEAIAAIPDR